MANPRKPGTIRTTRAKAGARIKSGDKADDRIEDAVVVSELPEAGEAADAEVKAGEATGQVADTPEPETPATDAEKTEDAAEGILGAPDAPVPEPDIQASDGISEPLADEIKAPEESGVAPVYPTPSSASVARSGGFVPMVLGGICAAILGAAVLYYSNRAGWIDLGGTAISALQDTVKEQSAELKEQSAEITALTAALETAQGEISALGDAKPDFAPVIATVDAQMADMGARLAATDKRLASIETQPIPKAELPAEVVAAYEAKFGALQAAMEQRFVGLQAAQDAKLAEIEAALGSVIAAKQSATEIARIAAARAALSDIDMALDGGAGFSDALGELRATSDVNVPDILAGLAEPGVATLAELQSSYPDAARRALIESTRAAASDGSIDRMTAFFRTQLGARSLEPRDGTDPDAVLSRAEAAVGRGDLDMALAEIATLPETGQAELADWKDSAETRIAAKAALSALGDQLNSN